jgi:membrane protease YdiL (CAAX protease family)
MSGPESSLGLTPGSALLLSVSVGFTHLVGIVLLSSLGVGEIPGAVGMAALMAYGTHFAVLAPRLGEAPARSLALVPPPRGWLLAPLLLLPATLLVSELDNWLTEAAGWLGWPDAAPPQQRPPLSGPQLVQVALVQVLVLPLVLELTFRGLVQPALVRALGQVRGIGASSLLSALAFALGIANPQALPTAAASALLLGFLREVTGSLVPPLALHALMGLVMLGGELDLFGIGGFDDLSQRHTPLPWLAGAAALTALGVVYSLRLRASR